MRPCAVWLVWSLSENITAENTITGVWTEARSPPAVCAHMCPCVFCAFIHVIQFQYLAEPASLRGPPGLINLRKIHQAAFIFHPSIKKLMKAPPRAGETD